MVTTSNPSSDLRVTLHEPLENLPSSLYFIVTELKFDVGKPTLLVRHPTHPPLEDLSGSGDIAKHLFHVNVLVPQLIHSWQESDGTVPNVPRVVDEFIHHLNLGVLQPQRVVPIIHLESSFPNGASSIEVLLRLLPLRVLDPNTDIPSHAAD
ncbi:hypothetical protein RGQ29_017443 [Quercus rubra]|uniref:Uncharacterized protein n=1 Tax=Quercus rubra TaxID=3512 RepID=A0AAN7J0S0_QUERU|nr:hypothetical protein RGQ29_017443 [Quercus rubra]